MKFTRHVSASIRGMNATAVPLSSGSVLVSGFVVLEPVAACDRRIAS